MLDLTNEKTGNEVLPAGEYEVRITDAEAKETRIGSNIFWKVEMTITDGEFEGRKVFTNFNVQHSNEMATKIARQTLAKLVRAANGPLVLEGPDQLLGLNFIAVTTIKNDETYGERVEVKGYKPSKLTQSDSLPF